MKITPEERFQFETQGFLVVPGALPAGEREALCAALERLEELDIEEKAAPCTHSQDCGGHQTRRRKGEHYLRVNGLCNFDGVFNGLIDHPRLMPYIAEFMGDEAQLNFTWFIRQAQGPRASSWHRGRDSSFHSYENGAIRSKMVTTAWILDDAGPDGGCLLCVPGSHKSNIELDLAAYVGLEFPGSRPITVEAGDLVVFSECLLHCADARRSAGRRRNVYCNYVHPSAIKDYSTDPGVLTNACFGPEVRATFSARQRELTRWMESYEPG